MLKAAAQWSSEFSTGLVNLWLEPIIIGCNCVTQQPSATSLKQSVKDRLGPLITGNSEPSQDSSADSQVCVRFFFFLCAYVLWICFHWSKCAREPSFVEQTQIYLQEWVFIRYWCSKCRLKSRTAWSCFVVGQCLPWKTQGLNDTSCLSQFISVVQNLHRCVCVCLCF